MRGRLDLDAAHEPAGDLPNLTPFPSHADLPYRHKQEMRKLVVPGRLKARSLGLLQ
jgi:hypothetical protein